MEEEGMKQEEILKLMSGGGGMAGEMVRKFLEDPILFIEILVLISTLAGIGLGFAFCYVLFVL